MKRELDGEGIKRAVRDHYAQLALEDGGEPSERATACCAPEPGAGDPHGLVEEASACSWGCGDPLATSGVKAGDVVLDVGCGAGADLLPAARRALPGGRAIGVDMTPEMLERARRNAAAAGLANVELRLGDAENLPIADSSVDLVISNCVINLAPNKAKVYAEIHRVLRRGGRLSVSDIVSRGMPPSLRKDQSAWSGCLAGSMEESEYLAAIREAGLANVEIARRVELDEESVNDLAGRDVSAELQGARAYSLTITAEKPA